jgi:hypothetical protein
VIGLLGGESTSLFPLAFSIWYILVEIVLVVALDPQVSSVVYVDLIVAPLIATSSPLLLQLIVTCMFHLPWSVDLIPSYNESHFNVLKL